MVTCLRLISELQRRNVLRMVALYIIAAWLVMQVAEVVISLAQLPEWSGKLVLAILALGFPISLVVSWFYQLTPAGISLEKEVGPGKPITHLTERRIDFIVISMLCAAVAMFAYDKWWPSEPKRIAIAVIPFDNLSQDDNQAYFSRGISEEIRNLLAQFKSLKVISHESSDLAYKQSRDAIAIGELLNVSHLLTGGVRRSGNRVRISAQLIDASDRTQLWSRIYDRELTATNMFDVQAEIGRAISHELNRTVTADDERRLGRIPTESTEAYAAYLLGRQRLADRKVKEIGEAAMQFAHAIELDPEFAAAYSGLVDACYLYESYSGGDVAEGCPEGPVSDGNNHDYRSVLVPFARKAVELDGDLAESWISLGQMLLYGSVGQPENLWRLHEAHDAFEHGLTLGPSNSQGYLWYSLSMHHKSLYGNSWDGWLDAWQEGRWRSLALDGLEVDPLSIMLHNIMANFPLWSRTKEEALDHARRMIELAPDSPKGYERLGELSWDEFGRIDDAIKWEAKAAEIDTEHSTFVLVAGRGYAALGDLDMALAYIELGRRLIANEASERVAISFEIEATTWLSFDREEAENRARQSLAQIAPDDVERLQVEASLALRRGDASSWVVENEQHRPVCYSAEINESFVEECPVWMDRMFQAAGREGHARYATQKRLEVDTEWFKVWPASVGPLVLAQDLALLGRRREALDQLERLIQGGWRGSYSPEYYPELGLWFTLHRDITLDSIRGDPRFQALIAVIESDLAKQLENVRDLERRGELPTLEQIRAAASDSSMELFQ